MTKYHKPKRRGFIKVTLAALAGLSLAPLFKSKLAESAGAKKIKMLNAEGKLVEVDEKIIKEMSANKSRASNKEVQDWMQTSKLDAHGK